MKWISCLPITLLLTACIYTDSYVVEPCDIVVPQNINRLELGDNWASVDVTNTTITTY